MKEAVLFNTYDNGRLGDLWHAAAQIGTTVKIINESAPKTADVVKREDDRLLDGMFQGWAPTDEISQNPYVKYKAAALTKDTPLLDAPTYSQTSKSTLRAGSRIRVTARINASYYKIVICEGVGENGRDQFNMEGYINAEYLNLP